MGAQYFKPVKKYKSVLYIYVQMWQSYNFQIQSQTNKEVFDVKMYLNVHIVEVNAGFDGWHESSTL